MTLPRICFDLMTLFGIGSFLYCEHMVTPPPPHTHPMMQMWIVLFVVSGPVQCISYCSACWPILYIYKTLGLLKHGHMMI